MAFTPVNDGEIAVAPQLQQVLDALQGVSGAGQPIALTALDDASNYGLTIRNSGSGGLGLEVRSSADVVLLQVNDSGVLFSGAVAWPSGGTASVPTLFPSGDTNTGLYQPAADQIGISTGGTLRALINSSGLTGTLRDKGGQVFNVKAYGAVGDGSAHLLSATYGSLGAAQAVFPAATSTSNTTDWAGIASAVAAATTANGGIVYFPPGKYLIDQTVTVTKGITLLGSWGADDGYGQGDGTECCILLWYGINNGTMVKFQSATAYNVITGGGVEGMVLDGYVSDAVIAATGIHLKGTQHSRVSRVRIRTVNTHGIWLDDNALADLTLPYTSGDAAVSTSNIIDDFDFVYGFWNGSAMNGANAVGIFMDGSSKDTTYGGVTKNQLRTIRGSYYNGDLIRICFADNNRIDQVHGIPVAISVSPVYPASAGVALRFNKSNASAGKDHGFPAGNVFDMVNGSVMVEDYTHGNFIEHHTSEGGVITFEGTLGHLHYEAMDFVTEALYRTHRYTMTDDLYVPAGAIGSPNATGTLTGLASKYLGWSMPDGVDTRVAGSVRPYAWHTGNIKTIRLHYTTDTSAAGTLFFRVETWTLTSQAPGSTPPVIGVETTATGTVTIDATLGKLQHVDITLNQAYTLGDILSFTITREFASDTYAGSALLVGVTFIYQSTGPINTGTGTSYTANPPPYLALP